MSKATQEPEAPRMIQMTQAELAQFVTDHAKALVGGEAGTDGESSVHLDVPLSDFAVKVLQEDDEFKASQIVRPFNSKQRQNKYYYYEPAYFMISQVAARAEGTEAARAKYGVSRKPFDTDVYALKDPVTDETVANADQPIDKIYEDATSFIVRQFLLHKEIQFANAFLKAGVWTTNLTGVDTAIPDGEVISGGNFQKFNQSTSRPLDVLDEVMEDMQKASGKRPNTLVMTRSVFTKLKRNSTIKTTRLYTTMDSGTNDSILATIAAHLDIPKERIFVLDVVQATGATLTPDASDSVNKGVNTITVNGEGYATGATHDFVGGNGILMMYIDPKDSGRHSATAAVCCQWTGLYPDGGQLGNTMIKRYRKEEFSSEFIEGRTAFSYHVVAPSLGAYLADVI